MTLTLERTAFALGIAAALIAVSATPAAASGTVKVRQHDGSAKTYNRVTMKMNGENLAVTSSDGAGTLIIGKSACTQISKLVRCLPYDAVLTQYGTVYHISVKSGTLWFNTSKTAQTVPASQTQLSPGSVLLSMQTKAGTTVSVTGTVDEVHK